MSNTGDGNGNSVSIETSQTQGKPAGAPSGLNTVIDPPSYEEAINPSVTPPPSYESLFGRVREVRKSSKDVLDFIKNLICLLFGSIFCTIILIFVVVIPIAMALMGSLYMYQCPQGENIPVYLLAAGLLGIFKVLLYLSLMFPKIAEEVNAGRLRLNMAQTLLTWLMMGCTFLFHFWFNELVTPNFDPSRGLYCNKTFYLFSYWLLKSIFIFAGLVFCAGFIIITAFCCDRCRDRIRSVEGQR